MNRALTLLIILIATILATTAVIAAINQYILHYPSTGTVKELQIEAYLNTEPLTNGTTIDWGEVYPGESYYYENLTVVNTGTVSCTIYWLIPDLPWYLTEEWDGNNTFLEPSEYFTGSLTLTVAVDAPLGDFSYTRHLIGEQT